MVTLGPRGAVYVEAPGFSSEFRVPGRVQLAGSDAHPGTIRTALVPAPPVDAIDPTGCGDIFGATLFASLLAGRAPEGAIAEANRIAARNAIAAGRHRARPAAAGRADPGGRRMTRIVEIPASLDDRSFEQFAESFSAGR